MPKKILVVDDKIDSRELTHLHLNEVLAKLASMPMGGIPRFLRCVIKFQDGSLAMWVPYLSLGISMPGLNGVEMVRQLTQQSDRGSRKLKQRYTYEDENQDTTTQLNCI